MTSIWLWKALRRNLKRLPKKMKAISKVSIRSLELTPVIRAILKKLIKLTVETCSKDCSVANLVSSYVKTRFKLRPNISTALN